MTRKEKLVTDEYYHIYNRGVDKRDIFSDEDDIDRFLESIYIFNQINPVRSIREQRENYGLKRLFSEAERLSGAFEPLVEVIAISLLSNHFHILLKQKVDGGVSELMKRVLGGYTKYFNDKNERSGVLFQGPFKSKLCGNDLYFKLLFCYVTFNSKVHNITKEKLQFVWSSWDEYTSKKFILVSKVEAKFVLDLFGGLKEIIKYAKDTITTIRKNRGKTELGDYDFEI